MTASRVAAIGVALLTLGCRASSNDASARRAAAESAAKDTTMKAWNHETGVDSVVTSGDTTIVWVSPRNWMATDAPQAGVRVLDGRVVAVQWILGG